MATGKIITLYSDPEKTEALFPRTKINAISDADGTGLDAILDTVVYTGADDDETATAPVDADTLGGKMPEDYATQEDLLALTAEDVGAVSTNGGTMSGALKLNGIILTLEIDYGQTLPDAGTPGRIYFKEVSE